MSTQNPLKNIPIKEFRGSKQTQFFDALKHIHFSGQLLLENLSEQKKWTFYFYHGRILYTTGGEHSVRRWRRNLVIHCPNLDLSQLRLPAAASAMPDVLHNHWEYLMLSALVEQQRITREQASLVVRAIAAEVLFDVTQAAQVIYLIEEAKKALLTPIVLLDTEELVNETQQQWQTWQQAKIADRFPNLAPVITQPEQLQRRVSASAYQGLMALLDGKRTLRELAIKRKRDLIEVTRSLLPYIQAGLVELVEVADLPMPFPTLAPAISVSEIPAVPSTSTKPLIACVDDSPAVCRVMETILTTAGYQFVAIQDSMRAIGTLLVRKPDLIFLDLVMPNTNGYEICSQLRKASVFRDVPIIILTGNDGIIDRVRAKVVGASDFLGKPVSAETVLAVAYKHLKHLQESSLIVG